MVEGFGRQKRPEDIVVDMVTTKFDDINTNIMKIFKWQERAEARIKAVEDQFLQLKEDFASAQSQIIGKAHDYNDAIENFQSSMEAFDKLLAKLSPLVAKSVNDLHITSQHMKEQVSHNMMTD